MSPGIPGVTYAELLGSVLDAEVARRVGEPFRHQMLGALEARGDLLDRLSRWRWLAIEDARATGATWAEIDLALGAVPGAARREYEAALARQKRFGLTSSHRADPAPGS